MSLSWFTGSNSSNNDDNTSDTIEKNESTTQNKSKDELKEDENNGDEKKVTTVTEWVSPDLTPEDVTCLINMISGCTKCGAFDIREFDTIMPIYQKLGGAVKDHPSKFEVVEEVVCSTSNTFGKHPKLEILPPLIPLTTITESGCKALPVVSPILTSSSGNKKKKRSRKRR
jgi:hypothetical protein